MTPLIRKANKSAEAAHKGQKRDSGEPYITHPRRVRNILAKHGLPEYVQIAGLLHDCLEDTHLSEEVIGEKYGEDVLLLVKGMTKGKTNYYLQLLAYAEEDNNIIFLKMADRIDNLRTVWSWDTARQMKYLEETFYLYDKLFKAFLDTVPDKDLYFRRTYEDMITELIEGIKILGEKLSNK